MDIYGLIGKNLSHSSSPEFFQEKFRQLGIHADYKLFEFDNIDDFPDFIKNNPDLKGVNVTIPFKRSLGQYMDQIDNPVQITGSINTIKIELIKDKP